MDNPEKLATFGYTRHKTQGNQEWTIQRNWQQLGTLDARHREKTNQTKNTTQKTKMRNSSDLTKHWGEHRCPRRASSSCLL
jgi:hypothetical protein